MYYIRRKALCATPLSNPCNRPRSSPARYREPEPEAGGQKAEGWNGRAGGGRSSLNRGRGGNGGCNRRLGRKTRGRERWAGGRKLLWLRYNMGEAKAFAAMRCLVMRCLARRCNVVQCKADLNARRCKGIPLLPGILFVQLRLNCQQTRNELLWPAKSREALHLFRCQNG